MRAPAISGRFRLLSVFLIVLLFTASIPAVARAAGHKNFIWKARSKTATVYLLGSIHYLKKDAYPLDIVIEDAFSRSNVLAVEANITDPDKLFFSKFIDKVFYPGNDTIESHVSRRTYDLVTGEFEKHSLPSEIVSKEKPWFLALTLTALEMVKSGYEPQYGVDIHFLSKAGNKKVVELESLDQQADLLNDMSDTQQEAFLIHTIKELETLGREADGIVRKWKAGDAKGLESLIAGSNGKDQGMASVYEKLLYERNRNMTARVAEFLGSGDTVFVVVGAAHLVGNKGIIELLRTRGYAVEQM